MKKILLASTATSVVMFSGSVQAQTCTKTPDCATLGYTKTASDCSGLAYTRCPFDDSKYSCEGTPPTCASLGFTDTAKSCYNQYIPCPTDPTNTSAVKCLFTNKAGDLKYSRQTKNHDGWLLASGSSFHQSEYPELHSVLGRENLPDYRGYFLKADAKNSQSYMNTPEAAGLPNITGNFSIGLGKGGAYRYPTGIITTTSNYSMSVASGDEDNWGRNLVFDASKGGTDPVYGKSDTVTPPNYTANLFIFAGKYGKTPCYSGSYQGNRCTSPSYGYGLECQENSDGDNILNVCTINDSNFLSCALLHNPIVNSSSGEALYGSNLSVDLTPSTVCYERPSCVEEYGTYIEVSLDTAPNCDKHINELLAWCIVDEKCLNMHGVPSF